MLFSQYLAPIKLGPGNGGDRVVRVVYRMLSGSSEAGDAHRGNRPSPFAVKLEDGRCYISAWGEPEELLAVRAKRFGLRPVITVSAASLYKLAPKGDVVTVRHVSPTAFRSYGRTIAGFVGGLYFIRPMRVLSDAGMNLKPEWERVYADIKPGRWRVRNGTVCGFCGSVTFYGANDDLKVLLAAAEFTGLGYKTGWGMGGIKVIAGEP
jgi:hypothetical protein